MHRVKEIFISAMSGIWRHKFAVFVGAPLLVILVISAYITVIYFSWQKDRGNALRKLAKYKELIDRTEEIRKGYVYNYSDVDLTAKVVDIPTRIYDRNNEIIGEFFEQKREIVPYAYIPKWLVKAVIASEDREFEKHNGISFRGIIRAMIMNIMHFRVVQGGSTITQQLAKVLFTDMDRSVKRKVYEFFCAREIERKYDKNDIMSMYLNLIYFGNGAYGIESASKMFFGKSVKQIGNVESAMIVATISNPKVYSPIHNLDNSIKKTNRIMQSVVDAGYLSKAEADAQYRQFLKRWEVKYDREHRAVASLIGGFLYSTYRVNRAPFFNEQIRRVLTAQFGDDVVKRGGLSIYTTIDGAYQDVAEKALRDGVLRQRSYHLKRAGRIKDKQKITDEMENADNIEGALVSINPNTGEIIAYVGGAEFTTRNQFDNVSQMVRQPGSSFKPLIYAAGIEGKDITPSTMMLDKRTKFEGGYSPQNYDGAYLGEVIVREALKKSINVVAVRVLDKIGYSRVMDIIQKSLSISDSELTKRFGRTLSLALGTYEISPLESSVLHSVIVNGGDYIEPYGIRAVKDYNDNMVWNYEEEVRNRISEKRRSLGKIIDPAACAVTVSMLRAVFEKDGTAFYAARNSGIRYQIAGKTGTSSKFNDAWFIGYTSNLVTSIWIGNKSGAISLGSGRAGGALAAPIWVAYTAAVFRGNPPPDFLIPDYGVTRETICLESGKVAGKNGECPAVAKDVLFMAGTEPGEYCPIHTGADRDAGKEKSGRDKTDDGSN